jgi:hypothetical protein
MKCIDDAVARTTLNVKHHGYDAVSRELRSFIDGLVETNGACQPSTAGGGESVAHLGIDARISLCLADIVVLERKSDVRDQGVC